MSFKLFETTFEHCPTGESRAGTHERHAAGSRSRKARLGQRAMAARLAPTPADLGSHVGNCLCRTLCGSVLRLRRLSDRLRVMDGPRPVALCGGLDQHFTGHRAAFAHIVLRLANAAASGAVVIAPYAFSGDVLTGRGIFGRDLRPVAFELLGD